MAVGTLVAVGLGSIVGVSVGGSSVCVAVGGRGVKVGGGGVGAEVQDVRNKIKVVKTSLNRCGLKSCLSTWKSVKTDSFLARRAFMN